METLRRAPAGPLTLQVVRFQRRHEVILVRPQTGGLGVLLQSDHEGYGARVRDIISNTPAAAAQERGDMAVGMHILAVNGNDVYNLPHAQVVGLISMGNQVTLLVQEDVTPVPQHGSIALLHARSQAITMNKAPNTPMGFRFISDAEVFGHVVTQVLIYLRRHFLLDWYSSAPLFNCFTVLTPDNTLLVTRVGPARHGRLLCWPRTRDGHHESKRHRRNERRCNSR